MKAKIAIAAAVTLLSVLPRLTFATPACVQGTLESYIALGAEGCIFDNALYYDFTYASPVAGAVAIEESMNPVNIIVSPVFPTTPTRTPGLNFSASWSVAAGKSAQSAIGYKVAPHLPVTTTETSGELTLYLGQAKVSGIIGSAIVVETASMALPPVTPEPVSIPPVSTAPPVTLEVYNICQDSCKIQQSANVTVSPTRTIQTTIVVTLTGGTDGVSLNSFSSFYAIGPQPG